MKAVDYAEIFCGSRAFSILCDEMYWERNFSSELCLKEMLRESANDYYEITDLESFDYDKYFHNAYMCTEKGLS